MKLENNWEKDLWDVYIAGWRWKLWSVLTNAFKDVQIWINGKINWDNQYIVWELKIDWETKNTQRQALWIIATKVKWIPWALNDFSQIKWLPIIVASTWYKKQILELLWEWHPILLAPNLALPILSIFKIFEDFEDFSWMHLQIEESHQNTKEDPSWTAKKIIDWFKEKGWDCTVIYDLFQIDWKSHLWDLTCYRWEYSQELWVPDAFLDWHGYHKYKMYWNWENFEYFKNQIKTWFEKYNKSNLNWFEIWYEEENWKIVFWHFINGRQIYADWLKQILPWFLNKWNWIFEVEKLLED